MYNVVFVADNGLKYAFGENGNTVFDMDLGSGVSVDLGTTQGFSQIGETVLNQSVSGRPIKVNGVVFGNVKERKETMRKVFAPFMAGNLIFEKKYYTRVYVKTAPSFSSVKNDGRFSMQLFAPYPFFQSVEETNVVFGEIAGLFRFPVNYANSHRFGTTTTIKRKTIYNDGDVSTPFKLEVFAIGGNSDVTISNLNTFKFLKINGDLNAGDSISVYRDKNNVLRAELTTNGQTFDAIERIDENSSLFELDVGDNLIGINSNEGGENLDVAISFNHAVVALYED